MEFLPADYVILAFTGAMAVLGLFRGLSGTVAFLAATSAASLAATFGWGFSAAHFEVFWQRAAAVGVGTLIVFGLVRMIVRKFVNVLLAQPGDAIFGFLSGLVLGAIVIAVWGWFGVGLEYSNLAAYAHSLLV